MEGNMNNEQILLALSVLEKDAAIKDAPEKLIKGIKGLTTKLNIFRPKQDAATIKALRKVPKPKKPRISFSEMTSQNISRQGAATRERAEKAQLKATGAAAGPTR